MHALIEPNPDLLTFTDHMQVVVVGLGGIGRPLLNTLADHPRVANVHGFSRQPQTSTHPNVTEGTIDVTHEPSIANAIASVPGHIDVCVITTGTLHGTGFGPEKNSRQLSFESFDTVFRLNTWAPAMVAKHALPRMARGRKAVLACLSARVGSLEDNRLGGWYAYRASKAALNMVLKTMALEVSRSQSSTYVVGLHPGTVQTALSEPFLGERANVFSPAKAVHHLLTNLDRVGPEHNGRVLAWDGQVVPY